MISALGLDLDNTLYDHALFVEGAYRDVALAVEEQLGIPWKPFFGMIWTQWGEQTSRSVRIFSDALKMHQVYSPEIEARLVETYRNHRPDIALYPGVRDRLSQVKKAGVKMGLLTDGQVPVQRRKIKALGIEEFFDPVVITGRFGRQFYKPHPKGFKQLARGLSVSAGRMAYIGDNPFSDFEAPKKMGMVTIRVQQGEYQRYPDDGRLVDKTFDSICEALDWFLEQAATF